MFKLFSFLCMISVLFSCKAQNNTLLNARDFEKGVLKKDVQILDVRTSVEFNRGHIKNAMQANWNDQEEFMKRAEALDKTKPVYIYCQAGGRSAAASSWMGVAGFKQVYELEGGMLAWQKMNKEVIGAAEVAQITKEAFDQMVNNDKVYLIDFGADWCPPCVKMKPVIEALAKENKDKFTLINIDGGVQIQLMKDLSIESLPTFLVYKNGKMTMRFEGITEKVLLEKHLQ